MHTLYFRRGHWRDQKFGENFSQTKKIYIHPTIITIDNRKKLIKRRKRLIEKFLSK